MINADRIQHKFLLIKLRELEHKIVDLKKEHNKILQEYERKYFMENIELKRTKKHIKDIIEVNGKI